MSVAHLRRMCRKWANLYPELFFVFTFHRFLTSAFDGRTGVGDFRNCRSRVKNFRRFAASSFPCMPVALMRCIFSKTGEAMSKNIWRFAVSSCRRLLMAHRPREQQKMGKPCQICRHFAASTCQLIPVALLRQICSKTVEAKSKHIFALHLVFVRIIVGFVPGSGVKVDWGSLHLTLISFFQRRRLCR